MLQVAQRLGSAPPRTGSCRRRNTRAGSCPLPPRKHAPPTTWHRKASARLSPAHHADTPRRGSRGHRRGSHARSRRSRHQDRPLPKAAIAWLAPLRPRGADSPSPKRLRLWLHSSSLVLSVALMQAYGLHWQRVQAYGLCTRVQSLGSLWLPRGACGWASAQYNPTISQARRPSARTRTTNNSRRTLRMLLCDEWPAAAKGTSSHRRLGSEAPMTCNAATTYRTNPAVGLRAVRSHQLASSKTSPALHRAIEDSARTTSSHRGLGSTH